MTSKLRTLLYLLLACAVLLLVDLVYLASNNSGRHRSGYSVRRGSKDHGSRWNSDNNGAVAPLGTIVVPINSHNTSGPKPPSVHDRQRHDPFSRHSVLSPHDLSPLSAGFHQPGAINSQKVKGHKSSDASANVAPPPLLFPLHAAVANEQINRHGADQSQAFVINKSQPVVQFHAKSKGAQRSEYTNPNISCSIGKSRQRMANLYGSNIVAHLHDLAKYRACILPAAFSLIMINASLPAFIDARFAHIPEILKYPPPFGFENLVPSVFKLLNHLPDTGLPEDLKQKSCLRCVVVGNGGILRRSALGNVINNFDIVIRMNDAPTRGFEKDAGSKTTIRIFYPESAPKKEKHYDPGNWLFLMMAFKPQDLSWLETMAKGQRLTSTKEFWKKPAVKVPKRPEDFRLLNPSIVRETAFDIIGMNPNNGKMKANVPTTGSIAILLSLRFCDEVAIAGFGYNLNDPNSPLHYYDGIKMNDIKRSWTHDITQEKAMLLQLVRQGIIVDLTGGIR